MLTIHKASAGSGKTFSLARKYLKLLLFKKGTDGDTSDVDAGWTHEPLWSDASQRGSAVFLRYRDEYIHRRFPKAHRHILAITFTNKATNEMTERIVAELEKLRHITEPTDGSAPWDGAERPRNDHIHYLVGIYCGDEETPEATATKLWETDRDDYIRRVRQISHGAGLALSDVLINFADFNVSTIDSFFQSVLHVFTSELDLPENFSLQIDESNVIRMAVDQMLNDVKSSIPRGSASAAVRRWLRQYMLHLAGSSEGQFNIFSDHSSVNRQLVGDVKKLRNEFFKKHISEFNRYFHRGENGELDLAPLLRFTEYLRQLTAGPRFDAIREEAEALLATPMGEKITRNVLLPVQKWSRGDFAFEPSATLRNAAGIGDKEIVCYTGGAKKKPEGWTDGFDSRLRRLCADAIALMERAGMARLLLGRCYLLGLFAGTCDNIDTFCREHDMFFLGDTNTLLGRVLKEGEVPFVYEKMGTQLNHLLIDEFQDTSEMNWDNLRPLMEETLSRGRENLIIGDVKQSIYRFRNARPELLGSEAAKSLGEYHVTEIGSDIGDNTNWRSAREVVKFNNSLFTALAADFEGIGPGTTYHGVVQRVAFPDREGFVQLFLNGTDEPFSHTQQLELMGANILDQLRRGFPPSQIGVLVRTGGQGQEVIDYILSLKKNDPEWLRWQQETGRTVDIISNDAMTVGSSQSVKSVVNLLRLCVTPPMIDKPGTEPPRQVENPAWLRNRMMQIFEVLLLRYPPAEALWKAVSVTSPNLGVNPDREAAEVRDLIDGLLADLEREDKPDLFLLTERIIRDFILHPDRRTEPVGESEVAFITAFQDMVLDFCENDDPNIAAFLKWWDRSGCVSSFPEADIPDAITVMTIHKSKGLEMNCVHVPFCEQELVKEGESAWFSLAEMEFPGCDPADVPPFMPLAFSRKLADYDGLARQTADMVRSARLDSLNVAYVAFTRARYELAIYGEAAPAANPKDGDRCKELGQNLLRVLRDELAGDPSIFGRYALSGEPLRYVEPVGNYFTDPRPFYSDRFYFDGEDEGATDPARQRPVMPLFDYLRLGRPVDPSTIKKESRADRYPRSTAWFPHHRIDYTHRKHRRVDSPASFDAPIDYDSVTRSYFSVQPPEVTVATDAGDRSDVFSLDNPVHLGTFLHEVLAGVKRPADLDYAFLTPAYRRNLTEADYAPLREQLREALADPDVSPYFTEFLSVMNERPLTNFAYFNAPDNKASDIPMVVRPDRVVEMPGATVVLDYKFGEPKESYINQVRHYCALLAQTGRTNVKGYLLYPFAPPGHRLLPV